MRIYDKDGRPMDGEVRRHYVTGGLLEVFMCGDGYRHGEYKWYYETGELGLCCEYSHGVLHGDHKTISRDGVVLESMIFRVGKRHGDFYSYTHGGLVIGATMFYDGVDLRIDPRGLSGRDRMYIMISGRRPDGKDEVDG